MAEQFELTINGQKYSTTTDSDRPLLDVLREDFHLTGTKFGCGEAECGACTVLVDGEPTRSCVTAIEEVGAREVQTIEGLANDGELTQVQQAFIDKQAMQCGYCVPGHIMTATAFVRDNPDATRQEVIDVMSDHICRCCNYSNILEAVVQAVAQRKD